MTVSLSLSLLCSFTSVPPNTILYGTISQPKHNLTINNDLAYATCATRCVHPALDGWFCMHGGPTRTERHDDESNHKIHGQLEVH